MNEIDEFRLDAFENVKLYKEMTKLYYDKHNLTRQFESGNQVLLYNSRLKLFLKKLKSRWFGSFNVVHVFPHGTVEIKDKRTSV